MDSSFSFAFSACHQPLWRLKTLRIYTQEYTYERLWVRNQRQTYNQQMSKRFFITSIIELSRSAKAAATQPWKNLTCFSASMFWKKGNETSQD
jgi:hypothetical protein